MVKEKVEEEVSQTRRARGELEVWLDEHEHEHGFTT